MPVHNNAEIGEIAKTVLMPGDPLRAKYIAENFLDEYKLVNDVRNIFAYTGKYKGKEISIMASGMGMPSMGIYAYELYKFYGVENIIRIGSCGVYVPDIELLDILLVNKSYTEANFAKNYSGKECHILEASDIVNNVIEETAKELDIHYIKENIACTECFDPYMENVKQYLDRLPKEEKIVGSEMESFALFYIAKLLNKNAACLLTVVDSNVKKQNLTSEERMFSLNKMIKIALESAIKL